MTDDRDNVLDVWVAIEEFVSSAEGEDSTVQKDQNGNAESNAQSGDAGRLDRGNERDYLVTDQPFILSSKSQ